MLGCVAHRGPDDQGVWTDRDAGLVLGHRRLAIVDLSASGHQPMQLDPGGDVLVFNGEIYNFPELRRDLERTGTRFRSRSDSEVLLRAYQRWGESVVDRLVGMFAFAVWTPGTRTLFLARDRAGEKPLYYAHGPFGFAFASEVGALAGLAEVDTGIDQAALALYLQFQSIPAPLSIHAGIRKLAPGSTLTVTREGVRVRRFWDPASIAAGPRLDLSEDEACERLDALLSEAVRGQMIADVPLGAFLSGGVDSTLVVAKMVERGGAPVRTFTIGFELSRYDESEHAAAVARHLGTDHTAEYLTEREALEIVPLLPVMYGEPFADSSALPTYLVASAARKHVTVSLTGDGGDEPWGGYTRYDWFSAIQRTARTLGPLAEPVGALVGRAGGRAGRAARIMRRDPGETYRRLVSLFSPEQAAALVGRDPEHAELARAWATNGRAGLRRRAMLSDLCGYLPDTVLAKVDRAAMAVSLETRAPLLDHRILEFALRLPEPLIGRKRLLRRLVRRHVPDRIMDRPKQGFGVPMGRWMRTDLRELLLDTVTPGRMRDVGVENWSLIRSLVDSHLSGAEDHTPRLWTLLVLGLWAESHGGRRAAPLAATCG